MDLIAFALRAEHEGTVEQDGEQVPAFGGGVFFVGDGDFHLRDELEKGEGTVTVRAADDPLVQLLDVVPVLKRVPVPTNPKNIVSRYARRTTDALRFDAGMREISKASSLSRPRLVAALEAHDAAQLVSIAAAKEVADNADQLDVADDADDGDPGETSTDGSGDSSGDTSGSED